MSNGKREHVALSTKFSDDKKVITWKMIFVEASRFNARCMFPVSVPLHFALLYMLQSGEYVLSADFVSVYRKLNFHEAQTYWKIINKPLETTMKDVMTLVFAQGSSLGVVFYLNYNYHRLQFITNGCLLKFRFHLDIGWWISHTKNLVRKIQV